MPYHDQRVLDVACKFLASCDPTDHIIQIGDLLDAPEPSRWNKGAAGEYADTLQDSINTCRKVLAQISEAFPGTSKLIKMGNHDERVETYVRRYAPALSSLDALRFESLLGLEAAGWTLARRPVTIAPGWMAAHGHESSMSRYAGGTAIGLARRFGASVVCGHTHSAGLIAHSAGVNGKVRTVYGLEVGNMMRMDQAQYLKYGGADWQQAFGILHQDGQTVIPELVHVKGGRFYAEGRWWK